MIGSPSEAVWSYCAGTRPPLLDPSYALAMGRGILPSGGSATLDPNAVTRTAHERLTDRPA